MIRTLLAAAVCFGLSSPAWAVKTQHFTQTSADEFNAGATENVVATSNGQLRLSRQIDPLLPADRHFDAVQALTEAPDGALVFAAFPDGEVLRLKDGKLTTLATFKDQTVNSLAYDAKGRLLIGVGGEQAKLVRIDKPGDAPTTVAEPKDARYVWAIVPHGDDLLLATGPGGQVVKVDAKNAVTTFATLAGENVTCLIAGPNGDLYAGTDGEALVYKIDGKTGKPFVLYDAAESEISTLALDAHGNLLAATSQPEPSDADTAKPDTTDATPAKPDADPAEKAKTVDRRPDAIPHDTPTTPKHTPVEPTTKPAVSDTAEPTPDPAGNAVYRIDPQGFVTELFRKPVIIYGLAVRGDAVLLSTGDDGHVYELSPDTGDEAVLLRTDAPDATGLLAAKDGALYVTTSNAGQVYKLSAGYAKTGTYESDVLDAAMPSRFGRMHLLGTLPQGTTLTVQTRTGNIADPDADGWADWTAPVAAKEYLPVAGGPGRYLQYRLNFETTDTAKSAVVDEVSVAYQKPNVAPRVTGIAVAPGDAPGQMTVAWEAADANDDDLRYALYVREVGQSAWMQIAKDLTETTHGWTSKNLADGHYELKVVATDAAGNPPGADKSASRTGDAVLVDNTPPVIGDVKATAAQVTLRVVDRAGTVASVDTSLDAVDHWQRRLPDDTIADSPEERYTVPLPGLGKGSHTLLVRATDARGNASFETVAVTVP